MKLLKALTVMAVIALCFSVAFAAGDAASGKILFNDPALGGSTNDMSCNTCHPGGMKLENAGTRDFSTGEGAKSLEEMINVCVTNPLRGKALALDSVEMQDLVAYIKSLGK